MNRDLSKAGRSAEAVQAKRLARLGGGNVQRPVAGGMVPEATDRKSEPPRWLGTKGRGREPWRPLCLVPVSCGRAGG